MNTEIVGKPGWKTSEFWLNVVGLVSTFLITIKGDDWGLAANAQGIAAVAPVFVSAIYSLARAATKVGAHKAIAEQNAAVANADAVAKTLAADTGPRLPLD